MKNNLCIISVFVASLLLTITFSCKKDPPKVIPTLNTSAATNITSTTATSGGIITSDGNSPVTSKGVCWGANQNPTVSDNKTNDGTGISSFSSSITGLSPGGTYYARAYATNAVGTAYGNQITITTLSVLPILTTTALSAVTTTTATSGGNITSDGGSTVTAKGVCWSTSHDPTTSNSKTTNGTGSGSFTSNLTGLVANTLYYVRAYANNSVGTSYGSEVSFTTSAITSSTVTDIDGNVYKTVTIGTQTWMAENLKTTKYRNGNSIGTTTPATLDISNSSTYPAPKYQWAYAGNESNVAIYGRLYTWYAATDSRNVCPTGWHLPSDAEWTTLTTNLGGASVAGGKLKEAGTSHWSSPNTGATNSSGFTALPGGYRSIDGTFYFIGNEGDWWSSTENNTSHPVWIWDINFYYGSANRASGSKTGGFSVRCLRDN